MDKDTLAKLSWVGGGITGASLGNEISRKLASNKIDLLKNKYKLELIRSGQANGLTATELDKLADTDLKSKIRNTRLLHGLIGISSGAIVGAPLFAGIHALRTGDKNFSYTTAMTRGGTLGGIAGSAIGNYIAGKKNKKLINEEYMRLAQDPENSNRDYKELTKLAKKNTLRGRLLNRGIWEGGLTAAGIGTGVGISALYEKGKIDKVNKYLKEHPIVTPEGVVIDKANKSYKLNGVNIASNLELDPKSTNLTNYMGPFQIALSGKGEKGLARNNMMTRYLARLAGVDIPYYRGKRGERYSVINSKVFKDKDIDYTAYNHELGHALTMKEMSELKPSELKNHPKYSEFYRNYKKLFPSASDTTVWSALTEYVADNHAGGDMKNVRKLIKTWENGNENPGTLVANSIYRGRNITDMPDEELTEASKIYMDGINALANQRYTATASMK